jgi:hypothetical protein
MKRLVMFALITVVAVAFTGCKKKEPTLSERMSGMAEEAGKAASDAAKKAEKAAADAAKEAEKAGAAAKKSVDSALGE